MPFRGDRLRERREAMKNEFGEPMSQTELGAIVGSAQSIIFRYEKNQHEPKAEMAGKLADAVNTSVDYLLGRTDDPSPKPKLTSAEQHIINAYRAGDFPSLFELLGREANANKDKQ